MFRFLKRWLGRAVKAHGADTHRTTLGLQRLESREVPANYYWAPGAGSDLLASTAGNWRTGPTTPYTTYTVAPDADDHLYFQANASNADCVIAIAAGAGGEEGGPSWSGSQFAGMHLLAAYEGTVELRRDVAVGTLDLAAADAAIWQNDPATVSQGDAGTLTVTAALTWTAGTLNSGSVPGTVELAPTAAGNAAPINGGTVGLGSTLKLLGDATNQIGSTLDMLKGTYDLLRGNGIVVQNRAHINFKAEPGSERKLKLNGKEDMGDNGQVTVQAGGTAEIYSINRQPEDETLALFELTADSPRKVKFSNDGTTSIKGRTELKLNPAAGVDGGGFVQDDTNATTKLEAGSQITCTRTASVNILRGRFEVKVLMAGTTAVAPQPQAIVSTAGTDTGLTLGVSTILTMPDSAAYSYLRVEGHFSSAGEVNLAVSPGTQEQDYIYVTKTASLAQTTAKLIIRWSAVMTRDQGDTWNLINAEDGVTEEPTQTTLPTPAPTPPRGTDVRRTPDGETLYLIVT